MNERNRRTRRTAIGLAALALPLLAGPATGQVSSDAAKGDDATKPAPAGAPAVVHARRAFSSSLLREGSRLVRARGRAKADDLRGTWNFVVDPGVEDETERASARFGHHELTLMPGSLLEEMERTIAQAGDRDLVFEITGEVFVFHGRNYLMLSHPALLIAHGPMTETETETPSPDSPSPVTAAPADDTTPAPGGDATDTTIAPPTGGARGSERGGDSADDIIRELDRSIGVIPRRYGADHEMTIEESGETVKKLVLEGTTLIARRGHIRRTDRGAFVLVFDADAEGLGDPPMTLLPTMLLERIAEQHRSTGDRTPVLVSGQVYAYYGRNFLLPTVYQRALERTVLTP